MKKGIEGLASEINQYDPQSRAVIGNLLFRKNEIIKIKEAKQSEGWKIMESKIREVLQQRITELTENDATIKSLLQLLIAGDTHSMSSQLESEIKGFLPEE
jgi:hypothetical protein